MSQFPFLIASATPDDAASLLPELEAGNFQTVLSSQLARRILGHGTAVDASDATALVGAAWLDFLQKQLDTLLGDDRTDATRRGLQILGIAALHAFLQSNVTGPRLGWSSSDLLFPAQLGEAAADLSVFRKQLVACLAVDGEAAYELTPDVELFCLANAILGHPAAVREDDDARWARARVRFWHQRMLSEVTASLQTSIYLDLDYLGSAVLSDGSTYAEETRALFLLERAAVHTHHGFDEMARADLAAAARLTGFEYVLTGRLGKRTRFQEDELSQLVVLARSREGREPVHATPGNGTANGTAANAVNTTGPTISMPKKLDLDNDTLLESISFSKPALYPKVQDESGVPASLALLDPADQPPLNPLDSINLLSLASSITATSPPYALTREESLPYATRVLELGSSDWQVYTQALLVRSRIEGYRHRTVERGVLQLQALVDQVIAETTASPDSPGSENPRNGTNDSVPTTFLPRPKPQESAPVSERLRYIHALASPTRWTLESELAARWVSIGGLRTALDIYERLEMWAEVALCWAAIDQEDSARRIIRRQLFQPSPADENEPGRTQGESDEDAQAYLGEERTSLPVDAPRLFCILGDIEKEPKFWERAWEVSKGRYARAQRSLGKHHVSTRDLPKAEEAYLKSLIINPQNANVWFSLGCVRLELQDWQGAVDAFSRSIKIEGEDGESWSNLGAALLQLRPSDAASFANTENIDDEDRPKADPQKHKKEAFTALKRASALKRDSYRIWQNLLNVAATLSPPPYTDILIAQGRLIDIRGRTEGESCIDIEVMEGVLTHIIASSSDPSVPDSSIAETDPRHATLGLEHMFATLVASAITPLITHSRRLWQLVARLRLHQRRPDAALDAYERAWRVTLNRPGWDGGAGIGATMSSTPDADADPEAAWREVVSATEELVDAYESLGLREVAEGPGAESGQLVCPNWRYKARMALRASGGRRAKAGLGGVEGLRERAKGLRGE
jgi:tetratricopeptide (TPR) repeat protein